MSCRAIWLPMLLSLLFGAPCAAARTSSPRVDAQAAQENDVVRPVPTPPPEAAARGEASDPGDGTNRAIVDMDAVVVSGRQPGPGMWKVSRGDHVLYILGTLTPLPRRMEWIPDDVERTIAGAQAVIDPPSVKLDSDVGLFRGLFLLPSLLKARRNPDGKRLHDVVPAPLYARWTLLKARYIGRDDSVETWRPVFAAQALYEAAITKTGLDQDDPVQKVVRAAARKYRVPRLSSTVSIRIDNPKAAIREFNASALADTDCFAKTLSRIEGDLATMRARANAWAVGDVAALRDIPMENQFVACTQAFTGTALAQKLGISDMRARIANAWLANADRALGAHRVSFATLSIPLLLREDGFLARLRAKGYAVEEP